MIGFECQGALEEGRGLVGTPGLEQGAAEVAFRGGGIRQGVRDRTFRSSDVAWCPRGSRPKISTSAMWESHVNGW